MFNILGIGALNFHVPNYQGVDNIKIYQELTHAVILEIPKNSLNRMPKIVRTLRTQLEQFTKLLESSRRYEENELEEQLLGQGCHFRCPWIKSRPN